MCVPFQPELATIFGTTEAMSCGHYLSSAQTSKLFFRGIISAVSDHRRQVDCFRMADHRPELLCAHHAGPPDDNLAR